MQGSTDRKAGPRWRSVVHGPWIPESMFEAVYVDDNFKILVNDSSHRKRHQHNDSATDI